jgi:hypothetical protein
MSINVPQWNCLNEENAFTTHSEEPVATEEAGPDLGLA